MQKDGDIRTQVEYYLSDNNLQRDNFFYNKILESTDGWIDLDFILACNKIKALGVSKEAIIDAVKSSAQVEINESGDKIRRKDNKSLPEAKFTQKNNKPKIQLKSSGIFLP